jgi:hypothetical protein
MRPRQDKNSERQYGSVAGADIQQATDRAAGALCELLGGAPVPVGEHPDGGSCR